MHISRPVTDALATPEINELLTASSFTKRNEQIDIKILQYDGLFHFTTILPLKKRTIDELWFLYA